MTAQHEEVVLHAGLFGQPENLGKGGGHLLFLGGTGRRARLHGKDRGGQRLAVHLATGIDGQRCHQHDSRRHHGGRQQGAGVVQQALGQGFVSDDDGLRFGVALRHHVGYQSLTALVVDTGDDGYLAALWVGGEGGLDLAQLDALTAQLDLVVQSAAVFHRTILSPARQVAAVIQAARRVFGAEAGVQDETGFGQVRAAQVAIGQLTAAQIQGAGHAGGYRAQAVVQNVQARVPDREADGNRVAAVVATRIPEAHVHGRLGGTVQVVQRRLHAGMEAIAQGGGQGLAAAEDGVHLQAFAGRFVQEGSQHGGHEVHHVHAFLADQCGQRLRVAVQVGFGDHQRGATQHGQEQLPDRHVEGVGCLLQESVLRAETIVLLHPQQPVDDGTVADHHALGLAGTARGVDDVGGVGGLHRGQGNGRLRVDGVLWGAGCRTPGVREGEQRRHVDRGHVRTFQQGARGLVHHHGAGLRSRQDALDARCRLLDVQRQVGGAGTLDGMQAHHHAWAAG